MNLNPNPPPKANAERSRAFEDGHKQARHAAAELAVNYEVEVDAILDAVQHFVDEVDRGVASQSKAAARFRLLLAGLPQ